MSLLPIPRFQFPDSNGDPLPGAKLYFYEAGTSTELDTYSDSALSVPNANPVVADSGGLFGAIYLSATSYKVVFKDASEVEQWTQDNVRPWQPNYEAGTFTPAFTFATPGNLSNAYTVQSGWYSRIGQLVYVVVRMQVVPTFTTASGNMQVTGLPYPADANIPFQFLTAQLSSTGIAYPTGTQAVAALSGGASLFNFNTQGSSAAAGTVAAANVTSGVSTAGLHISGVYLTDD